MRCQRCGFEIEPGQTFCSMCGTEQSKALRPDDKKKITSILGIIKVASDNHAKMFGNLAFMIATMAFIYFGLKDAPVAFAYFCLGILLFFYILVQCLIPYKNPNASKSKKYKYAIRICFILIVLLLVLALLGDISLIGWVKNW